jgi:hypothetical protein
VPEVIAVTTTDDEGGDAPRDVPAFRARLLRFGAQQQLADHPARFAGRRCSAPVPGTITGPSITSSQHDNKEHLYASELIFFGAGAGQTGGLLCGRLGRAGLRG